MKNRCIVAGAALSLGLAFSAVARAEVQTYEIDRAHSSITFKIRHLLSKVPGSFKEYRGTVAIDPNSRDTVKVEASIDTASIDTANTKRDDHLKGPDFFDAAKFPKMTFVGEKLTDVNSDRTRGKLEGTLTIRDVSKPVVLDVEWLGLAKDPWGNEKAIFSGTTTINRKDFGIVWNKTIDTGGYVLGDEVQIEINVEAQVPKPLS